MNRLWGNSVALLERGWQAVALMGVVSILLGILAITAAYAASVATAFILGCLVVAGAVVHTAQAFGTRGWGGFFGHVVAAILYGISGLYIMINPVLSTAVLTLVLAILLTVGGLYEVVSSVALRYSSWGWAFFSGTLSVLLGTLIFSQWPISSLWVIGMFVGIDLITRGWSALMLALAARSSSESLLERIRKGFEDRRIGPMDRRSTAAAF